MDSIRCGIKEIDEYSTVIRKVCAISELMDEEGDHVPRLWCIDQRERKRCRGQDGMLSNGSLEIKDLLHTLSKALEISWVMVTASQLSQREEHHI